MSRRMSRKNRWPYRLLESDDWRNSHCQSQGRKLPRLHVVDQVFLTIKAIDAILVFDQVTSHILRQ